MGYIVHDFNYVKFVIQPEDCHFGSLYSQERQLQLIYITSLKLGKNKPVLKHKELMTFPRSHNKALAVFLNITQTSANSHQISEQKCGKNALQLDTLFCQHLLQRLQIEKELETFRVQPLDKKRSLSFFQSYNEFSSFLDSHRIF